MTANPVEEARTFICLYEDPIMGPALNDACRIMGDLLRQITLDGRYLSMRTQSLDEAMDQLNAARAQIPGQMTWIEEDE